MPSSGDIPITGSGGGFLMFDSYGCILALGIAGMLMGGGWFLLRRGRPGGDGGSPNADDLNPQPLPPKGMGDGANQFNKDFPDQVGGDGGDATNQFHKGWDQFKKVTPSEKDPGPGGDAANQFDKNFPNQIGGDGGLTGNEIGGSGSDQLDKI